MEPQCIIQPRRLIDFLQDQNLPFPHHRNRKSTISSLIHAAVKSSNILRRRFSTKNRSSSSSRSSEPTMSRTKSVTVKDILRWKSFRDLSEPVEKYVATSYDFTLESPIPRSSSSDSDFTVGDSPLWCRGSSLHISPKGKMIDIEEEEEEDDEQFSPISVLDFTPQVDLIGRNLMLKQQRVLDFGRVHDRCLVNKNVGLDDVESFKIEEKAIQLMDHVKTKGPVEECDENDEYLLLDFFRNELISNKGAKNNEDFECRVLRVAKSWVKGEDDGSLEWELEGTREVCVREMGTIGKWNDIEDEIQEIDIEIEKLVLNHLLDELTMDLLNV